ncbi:MAG: iron-containing alcohol dehydrogenase [Bacillota bacterium]|nr:iron-containing alcohol dehydrogenase [Bacillota bacterium]
MADVKNKPYIDSIKCAGCSVCIENCPMDCLALTGPAYHGDIHTYAYLKEEAKCIGCGICAKHCPIDVITMCKPGTIPDDLTKEKSGMNKTYCRVFQAVMKVGNYFMGYRMPEYLEGPGCIKELPKQILDHGVKKVLLVTDPGLMSLGIPNGFIDSAKAAGLEVTVFSDIQPNPTSDNVEEGLKLFKDNKCDGIVAFGGGSPMDCAKGIASRNAHPNKTVAQLQGLLKVHKKICPFWAVPTTSGTGSETTVAAVITDSKTHHKASINDPSILPKYAVLDPELTMKLPPYVTATTGMDALCHAVESYTNWTYCTDLEKDLSKKAVRLIYDNLYEAFEHGDNLEARQNMQRAAFFAGRSFTRGCVGYVHATGHTLGGLYGVAHGLAMSVILPHVMRQFGPAVYDKLADLADVCEIAGATNKEKAENFISWIEETNEKMGLPKGFDCIKEEDKDQIIAWAMAEANPLYPVPVIWQKEDFLRLLHTLQTAK